MINSPLTCKLLWTVCVQQCTKGVFSASGVPLITKPGRASGQLKLPTGAHSKSLSSMNILQHGSGLSFSVWLRLPPQCAVSGFVSVHKSSLPTPLPRSAHCEMVNLFQNRHRNSMNSLHTADKRAFSWRQNRGCLVRIRDSGYAGTLERYAAFRRGKNKSAHKQTSSELCVINGSQPTVQHTEAVYPSRVLRPSEAAEDERTGQHSGGSNSTLSNHTTNKMRERIRG